MSCATTHHDVQKSTEASSIDQAIREKAKGSGRIELSDHQLLPIDYLHKHPEQKGLLINHYMGTGKTYLGIGFAQTFPDNPVIILAPRFLESHWRNQLKEYGVKNPQRFTFVSYEDAPTKLINVDVSKHIILADEVHNLIRHMRSMNVEANARYTQIYSNLRTAYKILGLTGTPIYGDESDIAFLFNFVSGKSLMPFNQEAFRLEYTRIETTRQYFRGYLTESNLMIAMAGVSFGLFFGAVVGPAGVLVSLPLGTFLPVIINRSLDLNTYKMRALNVEKMRPLMNEYVSYFRFDESSFKDFPAQDFKIETVPYNKLQYSFFMHLVEGDLPVKELQRLLKNESIERSDEFVKINSTNLHQQIYSSIGVGREIGNFEFVDDNGSLIESPKFMRILESLEAHNEQTVIYSNYYKAGILAFKDFLTRKNYKEKFAIIEPSLTVSDVERLVLAFNRGDIRLLMLHPEVTEGISLRGTQYLHILEPVLNGTVLEQVIGRTRRFQSHSHLPVDKQKVTVRLWQSTSSKWDIGLGNIYLANWFKRYRELSYMSRWGIGISQVDKNFDKKALNPEELSLLKLKTIEMNFASMQKLLTVESIESGYKR